MKRIKTLPLLLAGAMAFSAIPAIAAEEEAPMTISVAGYLYGPVDAEQDVITPAISVIPGQVNFSTLKYVIAEATETTAENAIKYGSFIQAVIDFLIIAIVVFAMVKIINTTKARFEKKQEEMKEEEPPKPSNEEILLTEIRDLLKKD